MTCWVLEKTIHGWELTAPSTPVLYDTGGFSFSVTSDLLRGFVGVSETRYGLDPFKQLRYAFYFDSAAYYVVNKGKVVYGPVAYHGQQRFHIVKHNGVIYYCVGTTPYIQEGVPFVLPGAPVYTQIDHIQAPLYLTATLLATQSTVFCAEELAVSDTYQGTASIQLPYIVKAAKTIYPHRARLTLPYSVISRSYNYGHSHIEASSPLVVAGSDLYAFANITAAPPLVYTLVAQSSLREQAYIRDIIHAENEYATRERAYLFSAVYDVSLNRIAEQALLRSRAISVVATSAHIRDSARLADAVIARAITPVTNLEQAELNDRVISIVAPILIREQGALNDSIIIYNTALSTIVETARINGYAGTQQSIIVRDTAEVDDRSLAYSKTVVILQEEAYLDETVDTFSIGRPVIRETAQTRGYAQHFSIVVAYLKDVFNSRSYVVPVATPGVEQVYAWTANLSTWAMSKLVEGAPARITTGVSQLGTPALKRVPNMYLYGDFAKNPSISVTGEVNGMRNTHTYTRSASSPTSRRTIRYNFGRGFHSTGYQFTIESDDSFTLDHVEVAVLPAGRRV